MSRLLRERLPFMLALVAASAVLPAAILHFIGSEPATFAASTHLVLVALTSGASALAAIALTVAGARRGDASTVLLGTAFSTMSALLVVHGLATPGVVADANGVVAVAGGASLPVGAALLSLSALPALRGPRAVRRLLVLQATLGVAVLVLGALGLLIPDLIPPVPTTGSLPAIGLLIVGAAFFLGLAAKAAETFALTRRRSDLLVVIGLVWLCSALVPQFLLAVDSWAFYLGHGFELVGIALVGLPVAFDLARTGASRPLSGGLRASELVAAEEAYLGAEVRSLLLDLERKDTSTEQHTRRVALLAVQVGESLGLAPSRMRSLALGGLLHDIGKLAVPGAVLRKPEALTDTEFDLVKRHPQAGYELLGSLRTSFGEEVRRLVRDHHERLDGRGYPCGTAAQDLGLETRILSVCDVYDALVSDRVYRRAWTPQRALGLLREETGTAFDPRCVAALEAVLGDAPTLPFAPVGSEPDPSFVAGIQAPLDSADDDPAAPHPGLAPRHGVAGGPAARP